MKRDIEQVQEFLGLSDRTMANRLGISLSAFLQSKKSGFTSPVINRRFELLGNTPSTYSFGYDDLEQAMNSLSLDRSEFQLIFGVAPSSFSELKRKGHISPSLRKLIRTAIVLKGLLGDEWQDKLSSF